MKKYFFVLLMLGITASAFADVFIYNYKAAGWGYEYDDAEWEQYKVNDPGYMIVEPNSVNPNFVNILFIDIWQEKDEEGVLHKYYEVDEVSSFELMKAQIGKKLMWVMYLTGDGDQNVLAGEAKAKKIAGANHTVAATLSGYATWYQNEGDYKDAGGGTMRWTLQSKFTNSWYSLGIEEAADMIAEYLETLGYEPGI